MHRLMNKLLRTKWMARLFLRNTAMVARDVSDANMPVERPESWCDQLRLQQIITAGRDAERAMGRALTPAEVQLFVDAFQERGAARGHLHG